MDDILPEGCQMPSSYEELTPETDDDTWLSTPLLHHYGMNAKRLIELASGAAKYALGQSTDRLSLILAGRKEREILE